MATTQQPVTNLPTRLEDCSPDQYNVLYPSQQVVRVSPLQRLTLEIVKIDPSPDKGRDVFKVGSRKEGDTYVDLLALGKPALQSIAHAAGIVWSPEHTGRSDDGSNPRRVEFVATGAVQKPDGTWYPETCRYEVDLNAIEAETRHSLEKKVRNGHVEVGQGKDKHKLQAATKEAQDWIDLQTKERMLQVARFKVSLADTGAHNRVIRSLLALKPHYTAAELNKPFVVPHISINPDLVMADEELRREVIRASLSSTTRLFGPTAKPPLLQSRAPDEPIRIEAEVAEVAETPGPSAASATEVTYQTADLVDRKPEPAEGKEDVADKYKIFWSMPERSQAERDAELKKLLEETGLKWEFKTKFESLSIAKQVSALCYYKNLHLNFPTKEEEEKFPWDKKAE
jgi:hypothetical protein